MQKSTPERERESSKRKRDEEEEEAKWKISIRMLLAENSPSMDFNLSEFALEKAAGSAALSIN
jgi:hypothetical protein